MFVPEREALWKHVKKSLLYRVLSAMIILLVTALAITAVVTSYLKEKKRIQVLEQKCGK
jgi:hypothetical protein